MKEFFRFFINDFLSLYFTRLLNFRERGIGVAPNAKSIVGEKPSISSGAVRALAGQLAGRGSASPHGYKTNVVCAAERPFHE